MSSTDLYAEHGRLVSLSFCRPLLPHEQAALDEVRDALDDAELAAMRPALDRMEAVVAEHESLADEIQALLAGLSQ